MSTPALLKQAEEGSAKFYLQFGGHGAPYFKELHKYYEDPNMKRFFDTVIDAIEKTAPVASKEILPHGLEFRKWLDDPETIPSDDYLILAGLSLGLIQVTQFAHYESLHFKGFDRNTMLKHTAGASGHSQGLIPATFAALQLEGDAYYEGLSLYTQYLTRMGMRAQETFPHVYATDEQKAESEELGAKDPAPMVAVLGSDHDTIKKMINETNATLPDDKKIFIGLYNSPTNRILVSFRDSLIEFHKRNKDKFEEEGIKFIYLRSTCAFHCPLMIPIKEKFAEDVKELDFNYKGSDLKFPVYSFADGKNLQSFENLGMKMCEDLMINQLDWANSMKPVADDSAITHVIDFGPGKVSQRLSIDSLKGLNDETPVLAAAVPKDLKKLTATE